jgi:hypothetical protein
MLPSAIELKQAIDLKQRQRWEKMKKRGHFLNNAIYVLIWLGAIAFVRLFHILFFRWGWLRSPGSTAFEDLLVIGVLAGALVGEWEWSRMKRKFDGLAAGDDITKI